MIRLNVEIPTFISVAVTGIEDSFPDENEELSFFL